MTDATLAMLLCSRLCHDLVSPVGAVNNGLEIMADEDDEAIRKEALKLIENSASQASARLQFMRLAFGAAGSMADSATLEEPKTLTESLLASSDIELNWIPSDVTLEKDEIRLLMNFILIGFEALPRGGVLRIGARKEGATNIMISAEGPRARMPQGALDILQNGADLDALEPRMANFYLTHLIAKALDASLYCRADDEVVEIAATL